MTHLLAVDIGGTKIALGLARQGDERWVEKSVIPTPGRGELAMTAILEAADRLLAGSGAPEGGVAGVGVSFGGHVDQATGRIRRSIQVPGWENVALRADLEGAFGAPVSIVNDATCGALGEWRFGAGVGLENVVYLTASTGVGAGLVLGGRMYDGSAGFAGEAGHLRVPGETGHCGCGQLGCVETVASGPAIARRAARAVAGGASSSLVPAGLTGAAVDAAARAGDALATQILAEAGAALGLAVSTFITLLDPQAVLIGGGVANAGPPFWAALRAATNAPLSGDRWVTVGPARNVDEAPLLGARVLAEDVAARPRSLHLS